MGEGINLIRISDCFLTINLFGMTVHAIHIMNGLIVRQYFKNNGPHDTYKDWRHANCFEPLTDQPPPTLPFDICEERNFPH